MTRPTPATALLLAALGTLSFAAPALAADDCAAGLDRLGQQAAALEAAGPGTPAPVTQQETAQLRALQQAAQAAAQKGNAPACQAILGEATALQDSIAHPRAIAADDLENAKLRSPDGKDLGSISELIIDPGTGRVAYAVVELGGFLGIGEADFAVPWALFTPSGDGYVLNVPKDKLTEAMVMGTPVVALCGKVWVPSRDPEKFPICPECKEIWDSLRPGKGGGDNDGGGES